MKILREIGITILIAIAIFGLMHLTVQNYIVQGACMEPNVENSEWIVVNKATYFFSEPERGDVVVFWPPFPNKEPYIKRVIGLPGEVVKMEDGQVFIKKVGSEEFIPLEEEYVIPKLPHYEPLVKTIPENEYFVLGDNRNHSSDSRSWGTFPGENIIGKAWIVYWPPDKWRVIKHYDYPELGERVEQEAMFVDSIGGAA